MCFKRENRFANDVLDCWTYCELTTFISVKSRRLISESVIRDLAFIMTVGSESPLTDIAEMLAYQVVEGNVLARCILSGSIPGTEIVSEPGRHLKSGDRRIPVAQVSK